MDIKKSLANLKLRQLKILEVPKKSSWVFQHFGYLATRKASGLNDEEDYSTLSTDYFFCRLCLEKSLSQAGAKDLTVAEASSAVQFYGSSTSTHNMCRHLEIEHKGKLEEVPSKKAKFDIRTFCQGVKATGTNSFKKASDKKFYLARDLVCLIAREMLPFTFAISEGFLDFCKTRAIVCSKEEMPSANTLAGAALDDVYKSAKEAVLNKTMECSKFGALTFDLWTDSVARNPYITYTFHFIDEDFRLVKVALATKLIKGKHTAENIKDDLLKILVEFGLDSKEIFITADGGRNVQKAIRLLDYEGVICLGHGFHNLVTADGLKRTPSARKVVKKTRCGCVKLRYKSPEIREEAETEMQLEKFLQAMATSDSIEEILLDETDELWRSESEVGTERSHSEEEITSEEEESSVDDSGKGPRCLKLDCPTRWHGILIMLQSIGQSRLSYNVLLDKYGHTELALSQTEWESIQDLVKYLELFKKATEMLSSEDTTANKILVLRSNLQAHLDETPGDSKMIKELKKNMKENFEKRFPLTTHVVLASILDPLYSNLKVVNAFVESEPPFSKMQFLMKELRSLHIMRGPIEDGGALSDPDDPVPEESPVTVGIEENEVSLALKYSESNERSAETPFETEINLYFKEATRYRNNLMLTKEKPNVLLFWKKNQNTFPNLSTLAKKILCIQATSTPSERAFSSAGLVLSKKRSRLSPYRVQELLFIHDNYSLIKKSAGE